MALTLSGKEYDLSGFDHPGGNHLLQLLLTSPDPEILLQYYHTPSGIQHVLKKFEVTADTGSLTTSNNEHFHAFRQRIGRKRMQGYRRCDLYIHTFCYFLVPVVYAMLLYGSTIMLGLAGILYSFLTIWTTHGNSHGIGWTPLTRWLTLWSGVAELPWGVEHVRTHHVYTNHIDATNDNRTDPDASLGTPFMRFTPQEPWREYHRFQHIFCYPLIALSGAVVPLLDLLNIARGSFSTTGAHTLEFGVPYSRRLLPLLQKIVYLGVWAVAPAYLAGRTVPQSCLRFAWMCMCTGMSNFFVNTLSHCNTLVSDREEDYKDIFALQLGTTVDIHPGNRIVNFLTAGLSHQVVHHLFPGEPFCSYPAISHVLGEFCGPDRYRTFPTYAHAACSHFRKLRALGRKDYISRKT